MSSRGDVWALISDVHGNFPALEQALRTAQSCGANKLAFLGDYLGRGEPDRCVNRIRQVADVAILGNRDLDWQDRVAPASKAWVLGLPKLVCVGGLLVSHGDARLTSSLSTSEVGRDFTRAWRELDHHGARVWAFGHSHHARIWRKASFDEPAERINADCVGIDSEANYFVNVGTTGLPFPGKGGPSMAIVDFRGSEIRQVALERI